MAKAKKPAAAPARSAKQAGNAKTVEPGKDKAESKTSAKHGKSRVKFENSLARLEAAAYFDAIVAGLRKGALNFQQGEDAIAFALPDHVEIELKAERKKSREQISFEITWHVGEEPEEERDELKITST